MLANDLVFPYALGAAIAGLLCGSVFARWKHVVLLCLLSFAVYLLSWAACFFYMSEAPVTARSVFSFLALAAYLAPGIVLFAGGPFALGAVTAASLIRWCLRPKRAG